MDLNICIRRRLGPITGVVRMYSSAVAIRQGNQLFGISGFGAVTRPKQPIRSRKRAESTEPTAYKLALEPQ